MWPRISDYSQTVQSTGRQTRHILRSCYQNPFMSYPPVRKLPIGGPIVPQCRHLPRVFDGLLHNHAKLIDAGEI